MSVPSWETATWWHSHSQLHPTHTSQLETMQQKSILWQHCFLLHIKRKNKMYCFHLAAINPWSDYHPDYVTSGIFTVYHHFFSTLNLLKSAVKVTVITKKQKRKEAHINSHSSPCHYQHPVEVLSWYALGVVLPHIYKVILHWLRTRWKGQAVKGQLTADCSLKTQTDLTSKKMVTLSFITLVAMEMKIGCLYKLVGFTPQLCGCL